MTDYWVSSKKHYCEVCRCWIAGTTLSIKNHESSARHISSLRKKMIDSHRKQVEKQQQDEFEKAEIERLNNIGAEGAGPLEETNNTGLASSSLFSHSRMLRPPIDKEKEQARVLESITRALAGAPAEDADATARSTTWMAFVDQEDGTLTYYNNFTGLKTKVRPRDFDGALPTASSSLTSNWTLKYDPSKGAKYYKHDKTGEVRWLDRAAPSSSTDRASESAARFDSAEPIKMTMPPVEPSPSKSVSQIKIKLEPVDEHVAPTTEFAVPPPPPLPPPSTDPLTTSSCALAASVKPEPEDPPCSGDMYAPSVSAGDGGFQQPKVQYAAPMIGQWEVVKSEQSAFSHSIVSMEPYLAAPKPAPKEPDIFDVIREATYETPLLNVDDLQVQEKQSFAKHKQDETNSNCEPVQFVKRKIPKKN